jgi:hypothetical protein
MQSNSAITWNWFRFNVPTIMAVAGVGLYINSWMTETDAKLSQIEAYRITRSQTTDANFGAINSVLKELQNIPFRVNALDVQMTEANKRMDRLSENLVNSVDMLREDVNKLTVKVELLVQKVDTYLPTGQVPPTLKSSYDGNTPPG